MKRLFGFVLCLSAACSLEDGEEILPVEADANEIRNGGFLAYDSQYEWVGLIQNPETRTAHVATCTGILIDSKRVVTAAHCFTGADLADPSRITFWPTSAAFYAIPTRRVAASAIDIHPSYNPLAPPPKIADVAILTLATPIVLSSYPRLAETNPFVSAAPYGVVGFGPASDDSVKIAFKRAGQVNYDPALRPGPPSTLQPFVGSRPGSANQTICPGDSGGPLIAADGTVVGIATAAGGGNLTCDTYTSAIHTALHVYQSFIRFPYQNPRNRFDTNGDGMVSPIDALVVINRISAIGYGPATRDRLPPPQQAYVDANGDGLISLLDPLVIINEMSRMKKLPPVPAPVAQATLAAEQVSDAVVVDVAYRAFARQQDQLRGLALSGSLYTNVYKRSEKWVQSASGWHFITPNGVLHRSAGTLDAYGRINGTPVASYTSDYYTYPDMLYAPR